MAWGLGIGAGVGLLKNELLDKPQAAIQNKLEAEKERYSPWTHQHGNNVAAPNPFDAALKYGATGALMARGIKAPNTSTASAGVDSGLASVASAHPGSPFSGVTAGGLILPQVGDSYMSGWSK